MAAEVSETMEFDEVVVLVNVMEVVVLVNVMKVVVLVNVMNVADIDSESVGTGDVLANPMAIEIKETLKTSSR